VLALYNTDSARAAAARPNFDPDVFAASTDTVFVPAPAHRQALCAPLVVGLLEQIRHATYRRAAKGESELPVFLCLDEVANGRADFTTSRASSPRPADRACMLGQARERKCRTTSSGTTCGFDLDELVAWLDETKVEPGPERRRR
jgi:hypothetical protein